MTTYRGKFWSPFTVLVSGHRAIWQGGMSRVYCDSPVSQNLNFSWEYGDTVHRSVRFISVSICTLRHWRKTRLNLFAQSVGLGFEIIGSTWHASPSQRVVTHGIGLSHFHLLSSASGSSDRISFPSLGHNNQRALGFIAWNVLELQAPHTIGSRKTARVILLAPPASRLVRSIRITMHELPIVAEVVWIY